MPNELGHFDRATLRRVLAATLPALLAACGTTSTTTDAGGDAADEPVVGCGGCNCEAGASTTYSAAFTPCSDAGALDASDDASTDAGTCTTCSAACAASAPQGASSSCISEGDDDAGQHLAQCRADPFACTGRRTEGLVDSCDAPSSLGEALARAAWLEAASVCSFRRLARELRAHGAPAALVRRAREAARDEIRHARIMRALAAQHSAVVARVIVAPVAVRDLETVARENAVEACVVETVGALLAAWQSERAGDPAIRAAMSVIAPDELAHASLAWEVASWIEPRLSVPARARIHRARAEALARMVQTSEPTPVAIAFGLPSRESARELVRAVAQLASAA